jgi:hypothetical protein
LEIFELMKPYLRIFSWLLLSAAYAAPAISGPAADGTKGERHSGETIVIVPAETAAAEPDAQDEAEPPRGPRKVPEVRDPSRGMYDPYTGREGDTRSLDQLSRDRLNIEGKRSRSLNDLGSPARERQGIDQSRGRLYDPGERVYGTPSLQDRLGVPDSRREYRIDGTRDLRQEPIDEHGSEDFRVYRTR